MRTPNTASFRILVINPNTTTSMTDALIAPINELNYTNTVYTFHTNPSPSGPPSINNPTDAQKSTETILPSLTRAILDAHDGFLVACFSLHPLVGRLRALISKSARPRRPVTGIFEASIAAASELSPGQADAELDGHASRWGIVTTAEGWRESLSRGVGDVCGWEKGVEWDYRSESFGALKFGGVETTGLNADELHRTPKEVVDMRMAEALGKLVEFWEGRGNNVGIVVLGCAGMVGWEERIRKEMERRNGGGEVLVIDPVKAGIGSLQSALRAGY